VRISPARRYKTGYGTTSHRPSGLNNHGQVIPIAKAPEKLPYIIARQRLQSGGGFIFSGQRHSAIFFVQSIRLSNAPHSHPVPGESKTRSAVAYRKSQAIAQVKPWNDLVCESALVRMFDAEMACRHLIFWSHSRWVISYHLVTFAPISFILVAKIANQMKACFV
jgi:hypothetical protein